MHVKVTKLRESAAPLVHSGTWDTYLLGRANETSLPVDYELEGQLIAPIAVGAAIEVLRTARNGLERLGVFCSTPVTTVHGDTDSGVVLVTTLNSIYRIETVSRSSRATGSLE